MTGLAAPLLFAAHLLSLLVAIGAALAVAREPDRGVAARSAAALGFLALAVAEAQHGAGFAGDVALVPLLLRSVGYALLLLGALARSQPAAAALAPLPGGGLVPATLALGAAVVTAWRRRREHGGLWLAAGLVLLAGSEATLRSTETWSQPASHGLRVAGFLGVARFIVALTRRSIRFRFLAAMAGVLVAVVLVVSSAVRTVIDRNLREGAEGRVSVQAEDAARALLNRAQDSARRVVTFGEALAPQIRSGSIREARGLVDLFNQQLDFIVFLDDGNAPRVLDVAGLSGSEALDVAQSNVVRVARNREIASASVDTIGLGGELAVVGAAPVEPRPGVVVGAAVVGIRVDAPLLEEILPAAPAAAFGGRGQARLVAETFPGKGRRLFAGPAFRRLQERARRGRDPVPSELTVDDGRYFVAAVPLRQEGGQVVGALLVAEPAAVLAATQRQVDQVLFLVMLAVIALAFLIASVAARRVTRPVVALTAAAQRVQGGDLEARADVRGEDEVADLARAFNSMTGSVAAMTGELRQAAEEQAGLRARLQTVLNSMGDGLIAVDDRGRVVAFNPAAEAIVGRTSERAVGRPLRKVLRGRDGEGRPLVQGDAASAGTVFVDQPHGGVIPVAMSSAPLRDSQEQEVGRVYVLRDMTREHEVERMKTEFLSNVSHELRTPLTPIIGYSEMMSRRKIPSERAKEFAEGILEGARRLERIVAMLVDYSAIEGGRLDVSRETVDLSPVLEGAVEAWRERSQAHRFVTHLPPTIPPASGDRTLLHRIVDELLDNAVKYSPRGGEVSVTLVEENSSKPPMVRVDVSDQGIGIEQDDLARIFQGFQQVDASETRTYGGLGLGLAFVKRVVEAHGGTITATSEPGGGSTFSFTVPAARREAEG